MNPNYPSYPPQPASASQYAPYPPNTTSGGMPSPYINSVGFNIGCPPQSGYPPPSGYPAQSNYPTQTAYPQTTYADQPTGYPPATMSVQQGYPPVNLSQPGYATSSIFQPCYSSGVASHTGYPSSYPAQSVYPSTGSSYPQASPMKQTQYSTQGHSPISNYSSYQEQPAPTVRPAVPFDPRQDAEILRKAMKGFGTDEKSIINVLTKRSNGQRQEIAVNFKSMYGKDLISDLKSELSGKLEQLITALMKPLPIFLAEEMRHAIEGLGTKESTIIEIVCTATNSEIYTLKDAYQRLLGRSLESDLSCDTSGHFRRLLVSMVQGRRNENPMVDESAAARDAQALMSAGVLIVGTDESTFNNILCTRSYPHLRRVFMEYQRLTGHTLEKAIRQEFSGDIEDGLLAIVKSVEDKAGFFAQRIRDAVACVGTRDRQLIRLVVSRCEIDLQSVKQTYQRLYNKSLEQDISVWFTIFIFGYYFTYYVQRPEKLFVCPFAVIVI